LRYR
jgi:hypothetical protein